MYTQKEIISSLDDYLQEHPDALVFTQYANNIEIGAHNNFVHIVTATASMRDSVREVAPGEHLGLKFIEAGPYTPYYIPCERALVYKQDGDIKVVHHIEEYDNEGIPLYVPPHHKKLLLSHGVTAVSVDLSGGSDVGYCSINLIPSESELGSIAEDQVMEDLEYFFTMNYSGAGDGENNYGTNIQFDLVNSTVTYSDWVQTRVDEEEVTLDIVM